jgi:c-di-GMP-binding flagellar brake protein YcgR
MPIESKTIADLFPALASRGTGATLVSVAVALTVIVAAILTIALRLCREWVGARSTGFPDVEWVGSDVVEEGMSVSIEAPTTAGLRSGPAIIRAVQKRWLALAEPDSADLALGVGAPLQVQIQGASALYRFHTFVRDRRLVHGVPTLYVERPPKVEKVQRRNHFRVKVRLAAAVSDLRPGFDSTQPIRGTVECLSGGGFRIGLPIDLPAGTPLRLRVPQEPLAGRSFEAHVIRCEYASRLGTHRFRASCEFTHLAEEMRNLIVSYCFEVQREAMRAA